ncbi:MAG: hypothetical protein CMG80_17390 [Marinobacter sp.]|nr:hypothetical protein [Marinobacter sp.]
MKQLQTLILDFLNYFLKLVQVVILFIILKSFQLAITLKLKLLTIMVKLLQDLLITYNLKT